MIPVLQPTAAVSRRCLIGALVLAACADSSGCGGGTTCPFGSLAFAAVEGRVFRANGSPYVANQQAGVRVSVGPGVFGGFGVPTDASGHYRITLDLPYDPGGETVRVALSAGMPPFAADTVTAPFSRNRSTRPTTIVNLHERP
jgi:hypothetical protein